MLEATHNQTGRMNKSRYKVGGGGVEGEQLGRAKEPIQWKQSCAGGGGGQKIYPEWAQFISI